MKNPPLWAGLLRRYAARRVLKTPCFAWTYEENSLKIKTPAGRRAWLQMPTFAFRSLPHDIRYFCQALFSTVTHFDEGVKLITSGLVICRRL
jgi:hypothetical protein